MTKSEGRNLEEINKKKILNFGDLSRHQKDLGISDGAWNMEPNWRTYMKKAQLRKQDLGYYITAGIKFYCAQCDTIQILKLVGAPKQEKNNLNWQRAAGVSQIKRCSSMVEHRPPDPRMRLFSMKDLIVYLVAAPIAFVLGVVVGILVYRCTVKVPKTPVEGTKKKIKASDKKNHQNQKKKAKKILQRKK
ncbi:2066_t:CDS:2 [Cetraspora pellucida]|uniref:2066_t:CDS:1 n=1 Tax=Cetraspora pellucida TaxID=1433469 RepID=A0ACA9JW89_9GLOM|nr:2066_t:CDS:2 [Cetraspora pellucida]